MKDRLGRKIEYMRISITDRCNLHCSYCRPEIEKHLEHSDILTYEEILQICKAAIKTGITKFKVTGGEPFVRYGVLDFIRKLKNLPGTEAVTVTTNGTLIDEKIAEVIADIKIDGINISLDTLNPEKFKKITGEDKLDRVKKNIELLSEAGLNVKINTVLLPDIDEEDVLSIIELTREKNIAVRFIETMPMNNLCSNHGPTGSYIMTVLDKNGIRYSGVTDVLGNGPAEYFKLEGYTGYVGLIEAIHGKFCSSCNRIRLTSTGFLKPCLYHKEGIDLRSIIRSDGSEMELYKEICKAIKGKPKAHNFETRPAGEDMSKIGG